MRRPAPNFEHHERYIELAALMGTGSLTEEESESLREHLTVCPSCKLRFFEYRQVVRDGVPLLAGDDFAALDGGSEDWNQGRAKEELLARLKQGRGAFNNAADNTASHFPPSSVTATTNLARYAFAATIVLTLCISAYWFGRTSGKQVQRAESISSSSDAQLQAKLRAATAEIDRLEAQSADRDGRIISLLDEIASRKQEIARLTQVLQVTRTERESALSDLSAARADSVSIANDREGIGKRLQQAQSTLTSLQAELDSAQEARRRDLLNTTNSQAQIEALTAQAASQENEIREQQRMLASDRDIRELMGARELYIADVFDVDQNGRTQKPFGRVFYTKNKSLIFYAFDLDKQPGLRNASSFQAWGLKDSNKEKAVSLGIFYLDNDTHRRWVLKSDDTAVLQKINAVFVTVEPKGGSAKPSGKQLLYAHLRTEPNHP